jgi:hypothetical protein
MNEIIHPAVDVVLQLAVQVALQFSQPEPVENSAHCAVPSSKINWTAPVRRISSVPCGIGNREDDIDTSTFYYSKYHNGSKDEVSLIVGDGRFSRRVMSLDVRTLVP